MRTLAWLLILCLLIAPAAAAPERAAFTFLKTVPKSDLNRILNEERSIFSANTAAGPGYSAPDVSIALNDVDIYLVQYSSQVPEQGNRSITATGLLALPVIPEAKQLPLISYQHGTVFGKYEVPSYAFQETNPSGFPHYAGAYETRYMVSLFAGNGYAVMAADYFGLGGGADLPEAYFVKASSQQASYDLYKSVQTHLAAKDIRISQTFLGGWSQGGLNTTGFLEKLEAENVVVSGSFTASSPSDPFAALNGLIYHPRPELDAPWLNTILSLTVFSFENYYREPNLAKSVIRPDFYQDMQRIYNRSYAGPEELGALFGRIGTRPLLDYFQDQYRDPAYFASSRYGRLLAAAETYRQQFKSPIQMFYGTHDEVIKEAIGTLPAQYQNVLTVDRKNSDVQDIETIKVQGADHRLTFVTAAPTAKAWMDHLREK